jgi:hypothetical protein
MKVNEFIDGRDDPIRRYVTWLADRYDETLEEAARRSLGRVMKLVKEAVDPQALITAFRSERKLWANRKLNKELEGEIRGHGWGFIPVLGGFIEKIRDEDGKETGEKKNVEEESFFVVGRGENASFRNKILEMVVKYEQESAAIKYPGDNRGFLLEKNGNEFPLGVWSQNKMSEYYTKMKMGAKDRQFAFEQESDGSESDGPQFEFFAAGDSSRSTRMAVDRFVETGE